jgi:hypothetical protein
MKGLLNVPLSADAADRGEEIGKREPFLSFALVSNCATHF